MPFSAWVDSNLTLSLWRLVVLAIGILILRRLPIILALYRWFPDCHTSREAVFIGCAANLWGSADAAKLVRPYGRWYDEL